MARGFLPLAEGMLPGVGLPRSALIPLAAESLMIYDSEEEVRKMADDALSRLLSREP